MASVAAADFIIEARKLIGVPYVHQGHSEIGVDCLGFLYVSASRAGLSMDRMLAKVNQPGGGQGHRWNYGRSAKPHLMEGVKLLCKPVAHAVPGCILFFVFPGKRDPQHFAIYTGESMIHAHSMRGCVVEHGYRAQWVRWTHSRWLLSGLRYG